MKINNLNEFYNYIKSKDALTTNSSLIQLCACVDQYKNICSCKQKEKGQKLFECNNKYEQTVNNFDQPTIDVLLTTVDDKTIDFYSNSNYIRTISIQS